MFARSFSNKIFARYNELLRFGDCARVDEAERSAERDEPIALAGNKCRGGNKDSKIDSKSVA